MTREPLTARGAEQLRRELEDLKSVQRPRVIAAIAEARAHGDLKENAEYHAAKEQQGFIEGRISEIEDRLGRAEVIDPAKLAAGGKVVFGATVQLVNVDSDEEVTYQIVGVDEADIKQGRVSFRAPLARALRLDAKGKRELTAQLLRKNRAFIWVKRKLDPATAAAVRAKLLPGLGFLPETRDAYVRLQGDPAPGSWVRSTQPYPHVVRGGNPSYQDRAIAGRLGFVSGNGSAVLDFTCFSAKLDLMLPTPGMLVISCTSWRSPGCRSMWSSI